MMSTPDAARDTIREFIWTNYLQGKFAITLDDHTRLRTSGLMDSLATVGLVNFVEKKFDLEFSAFDLTVDNFDTIDQIVALMSEKRQ